jgi:hypothetical protein
MKKDAMCCVEFEYLLLQGNWHRWDGSSEAIYTHYTWLRCWLLWLGCQGKKSGFFSWAAAAAAARLTDFISMHPPLSFCVYIIC